MFPANKQTALKLSDEKINEEIEFDRWIRQKQKEWGSEPYLSDKELLATFPEAKNEIIPIKIMEFAETEEQIKTTIKKKISYVENCIKDENAKFFWSEYIKYFYIPNLIKVQKQLAWLRRLNYLACSNNTFPADWLTEEKIQQALAVPIETILPKDICHRYPHPTRTSCGVVL